jgi:transglutaminase-like putative cysteine protease
VTSGAGAAQRSSATPFGELSLRPSEGWLSLGALMAMLVIVALAVDDARWAGVAPSGGSETGFLVWILPLAALWGFIGAKLRWSSFLVHSLGGILGATVVLLAVAAVIPTVRVVGLAVGPEDPLRLGNLALSVSDFVNDVFGRQVRSDQTSVFLLVVGCVAWASAAFAAYAVYRRHRPMSAILLIGLLLLASMSLTIRDQFWYLVLFSVATLLLLVRLSLVEQRGAWAHGRMGEETQVFSLYLRNGTIFIAVALAGALFLTSTASSDPLRFLWSGMQDQLVTWELQLDRFAGGISGQARGPSGLFGAQDTIRGFWEGSQVPVGTVTSSDGLGYYLRGATYDSFDGHTWRQTDRVDGAVVAVGSPILDATAEAVAPGKGRRAVTLSFTPAAWSDNFLLAPEDPYTASRSVQVVTAGPNGPVATIRMSDPVSDGQTYGMTALVRVEGSDGITGNQLAAAGTAYPSWAQRYVAVQRGSAGPIVKETADRIVAELPADQRDPYHVAQAVQKYLYRQGGFVYDTDVQGLCAPGTPVPDCLLQTRHGYCQYFATTMVMMLRTQMIPARYVDGYLPGRPTSQPGTYLVERSAAHAWVEVYFPKSGWIRYDPTPGNFSNGQQATELPAGPPVATPSPAPGATAGALRTPSFNDGTDRNADLQARRTPAVGAAGSTGGPGQGGALPLLIGGGVMLAALLLAIWSRRRRSHPPTPETAYAGVTRLAGRFGYGPRPSETAYEYADVLGRLVPAAASDLQVVATAKVQAAYGRRAPTGPRLVALRSAYGRLRISLLRLALHYRRRPRR